jgi:hypothetical protein
LQLTALIFYTLGYRSRIFGTFAFIFICSLQSRNNLILSAADDLMRMGLLWSLFVPLDRAFSVFHSDVRKNAPNEVTGVGVVALMVQLLLMYGVTAVFKIHPTWTRDFSAIYFALNIDMFTTPFGDWLATWTGVTKALTVLTLIWEFVGPLLALIPGWTRAIAAAHFILFHVGLFLSFKLGFFPWVCIVYWLVFLPPQFLQTQMGIKIQNRGEQLFMQMQKFSLWAGPQVSVCERPSLHKFQQSFCAVLFVIVLAFNLDAMNLYGVRMPAWVREAANRLYVNQVWDMFAPYPIKNDGWFVIEGQFQNGDRYDLWTEKTKTYEKPEDPSDVYSGSEWRKFMLNVWDKGDRKILLPYARYLCRKYSDQGLSTLMIEFVKETTPEMGDPRFEPEVVSLWNHDCFAK